jgi:hypothetical protein
VAVADREKVKRSPKKRKCRGERGWRVDGEGGRRMIEIETGAWGGGGGHSFIYKLTLLGIEWAQLKNI